MTRVRRNPECWLETIHESHIDTIEECHQSFEAGHCEQRDDGVLGGGKPGGVGVKSWQGELDNEGRFHGRGTLFLEDCAGQMRCHSEVAERVEGFWNHGLLSGHATLYFVSPHSFTEVVAFKRGKRQGLGVFFLDMDKQHLAKVTRWEGGLEVGPTWDLSMGRGFDVSKHFQLPDAKELPLTHHWGGGVLYNSSIWLYPDHKTALVGRWGKNKKMVMEEQLAKEDETLQESTKSSEEFEGWGRLAEVVAVQCTSGILQVVTGPTTGGLYEITILLIACQDLFLDLFKYQRPTSTSTGSQPTQEDPYERKMVKVAPSRLGGEGLHIR